MLAFPFARRPGAEPFEPWEKARRGFIEGGNTGRRETSPSAGRQLPFSPRPERREARCVYAEGEVGKPEGKLAFQAVRNLMKVATEHVQ